MKHILILTIFLTNYKNMQMHKHINPSYNTVRNDIVMSCSVNGYSALSDV